MNYAKENFSITAKEFDRSNFRVNEITNENVKRLLIGDGESFLTMIDDSDRGEKVKKARISFENIYNVYIATKSASFPNKNKHRTPKRAVFIG